jgi:hypothetical protein
MASTPGSETTMKYDLWDTGIGKYLGQYTDENQALATVKTLVDVSPQQRGEGCLSNEVAPPEALLGPMRAIGICYRARERAA